MKAIADTGFLVAFANRADQHHSWAVELSRGVSEPLLTCEAVLAETGFRPEQVCAVGDDLPDLPVLRRVGLAVAVADACAELRATADYVTSVPGGHGAVRDAIEWLLRCQGLWDRIVTQFAV